MKAIELAKSKQSTLVILFALLAMLSCVDSCQSQETIMELEINETLAGAAEYRGDFLIFRMYRTADVEYDCVRDVDIPMSRSNIFTKRAVLSTQDANEVRAKLLQIEKAELQNHYKYKSDEKWSDVELFSSLVFFDTKGIRRTITFNAEFLGIVSAPPEEYPPSLVGLAKKIKEVRSAGCRE